MYRWRVFVLASRPGKCGVVGDNMLKARFDAWVVVGFVDRMDEPARRGAPLPRGLCVRPVVALARRSPVPSLVPVCSAGWTALDVVFGGGGIVRPADDLGAWRSRAVHVGQVLRSHLLFSFV
jgi:hypothetical protein